MSTRQGWIGVDLDGTLAEYQDQLLGEVGAPIPAMVRRVNKWLAEGREVRIFTARAAYEGGIEPVREWIKLVFGRELEVTCQKDFDMEVLWDDRAVRVEFNTGRSMTEGFE